MSCKTCINYGIYEMITGGKPYGYSGDIPCNRCSRYRTSEDLYIENTLFKPSENCCCGEVYLEPGTAKEVDNVIHRKNNPCYISKPSVVSDKQIEKETLKVMLTNDEWMNLPDYYVKQIVVKVFHNLIMKGL